MPPRNTRVPASRLSLCIALLLLFASSSLAIDLSRAFSKQNKDDPAAEADSPPSSDPASIINADDALANAKKLVNDLNDAATGTVTSYQPGREKEPVTCNEIMAKSLVVANEEKAAIIAEKDAVVKAATLLSEKIDDLSDQLKSAQDENLQLEEKLVLHQADDEETLKRVKEDHAAEMIKAEQLLTETKVAHEAQLEQARQDEDAARIQAEQTILHTKSDYEQKMKEVMDDAVKYTNEANEKVEAERERSKINMNAIKNATSATIAKIEKDTMEQIAANNAELLAEITEKLAEAQSRIDTITSDSKKTIAQARKDADEAVTAANQQVANMEEQITQISDEYEKQIVELEVSQLKSKEKLEVTMHQKVVETQEEMKRVIALKDVELGKERKAGDGLKEQLQKKIEEEKVARTSLGNDIKVLKSESAHLQQEVSFWKDSHDSQSYCNTTLIREDSRRLVTGALGDARHGLESGHKIIMAGLATQLELIQNTGADAMDFLENELAPAIEKVAGEAYDKAAALYDEHLAAAVNEHIAPLFNQHVLPVYNQHILPMYMQHVSPVVKTIEDEAAVAIKKSQKEVQKARSGAANLVKQSSSTALDAMKEKEIDSMLPQWMVSFIAHSSKDGEWAVDKLLKALLILLVILCRSLIYRLIGLVFSVAWFFCPLRLFVGGKRELAKETSTTSKKVNKQPAKTNGKVKVY